MRPALRPEAFGKRLVLGFGLLVWLVVATVLTLSWRQADQDAKAQELRLAEALGMTVATALEKVSFSGRYHSQLLMEELVDLEPALAYLVLEDLEGRQLAFAGREDIEHHDIPALTSDQLGQLGFHDRQLAHGTVLEVTEPYHSGYLEALSGTLRIGIDHAAARPLGAAPLVGFLGVGGLVGALSMAFVVLLSRRLARPVHRLARDFTSVLDRTPALIYFEDRAGKVVRASQALCTALGVTAPSELEGRSALEVLPAELARTSDAERSLLFDRAQALPPEERSVKVGNALHAYSISRFPLDRGAVPGAELSCTIALDRTEQQGLEERLEQARRMETIGQFAGGVAHDFNNVLTAIGGSTELLLRSCDDQERVRELAEEILASGQHAASLTSRLLAFGRREIQTLAPIDLSALLRDERSLLERVLRGDIELEIHTPAEPLGVQGSRPQLGDLLLNLVANARDAMPNGGTITLSASRMASPTTLELLSTTLPPGAYACLEVRDQGTGIAPEIADDLFEAFTTTKEVGQGTGLGLPIVDAITKRHGGGVQVESHPGQGATFRVYLPLADGAPEERPVLPSEEQAPAPRTRGLTILLAEDNVEVRRFLRRALESLGHDVIVEVDGRAALQRLDHEAPAFDLVLVDVVMPRLGGDGLYLECERRGIDLPFLFITGHDRNALGRLTAAGHEVQFLRKPFTIPDLDEAIRSVSPQPGPSSRS